MRQAVLANTAALIGGLFVLSPAVATLAAQGAPTACSSATDQSRPKELALSFLNLTRVNGTPAGPARDPLIKVMLKDLMDKPEKFASNPGGYNAILSSVLSMAVTQPDGLNPKTRAAMGLTVRPSEPFDLIAELDSSYKRWEAALPVCAADIANQRSGEAWMAVTNKAFNFLDKGPADSAVYFAKRSLMLAPTHPMAHYILGQVATAKQDMATAIPEWKEVVKLAGNDSTARDVKGIALFYLGNGELKSASEAKGDAQKAQAKVAVDYFRQYLAINSTSPDAATVTSNLAQALALTGDMEGVKATYADMIANPTRYSEMALASAGIIASVNANDNTGASKLFAGMVAVNPLSRDGLRNLASTLYTDKKYMEVFPIAKRLVELDPNNYDGWMYFAFSASELEKPLKAGDPMKKAWNDTLVKYNGIAEALKARVEVQGFARANDGAEVTLQVEQAGATAGTFSVTMEFLDKGGAVVGTDTQSVGPLAKGEKKTVILKGKGAGIVAFRYKSLG
ncbi:MAG: tetratricopeptide repeat protein [Gemmatimonas sp.]